MSELPKPPKSNVPPPPPVYKLPDPVPKEPGRSSYAPLPPVPPKIPTWEERVNEHSIEIARLRAITQVLIEWLQKINRSGDLVDDLKNQVEGLENKYDAASRFNQEHWHIMTDASRAVRLEDRVLTLESRLASLEEEKRSTQGIGLQKWGNWIMVVGVIVSLLLGVASIVITLSRWLAETQ